MLTTDAVRANFQAHLFLSGCCTMAAGHGDTPLAATNPVLYSFHAAAVYWGHLHVQKEGAAVNVVYL